MVFSAQTIKLYGPSIISPYDRACVQPASYDLKLANNLVLKPHEFKLASTLERVSLTSSMRGEVHGRSSVGRLGVFVHITAGYIDPGFDGTITLECYSVASEKLTFYAGDRICQIAFSWLDEPTDSPYAGRYQGQLTTTESRFQHGLS